MEVFKFGGASVNSADAVRNAGKILQQTNEQIVVVISAMGKTTNLLEILVRAYFEKNALKWDLFS
jgi:aspartate kinase